MLIIVMAGLPLIAGYVLQIVIASRGIFRPIGVFNTMPEYRRGLAAAWLTSLTGLLTIFFLVDGGDGGEYGSAFTIILGNSSTPEGERISMILCLVCAVIWIASWVWLVVEWIVLTTRAKQAARNKGQILAANMPRSGQSH